MGGELEQNIKQSFSKVKEDICNLSEEINKIRVELQENRESLKQVLSKVIELKEELKILKNQSSTGNDGANQSINHLINQSITNQSFNQSNPQLNIDKGAINQNKGNEGVNHLINQSLINQSFNQSITQEEPIKEVTDNISKIFSSLSKQELKLFLTIYQLEDENIESSYKNLSLRMQLSEHCIRSHLSSLLKKNAPIFKKRLNNHTNLLSIQKDFRSLNLKKRLINLYYDADPHQKTLFDIQ